MPVIPIITAILGSAGSFFQGLFNFKGEQAKTVQGSIDLLKSIDQNDAAAVTATASALSEILTQGSFLERNWRSVLMVILMGLLISSWFGYVPPHFNDALSPMMERVFSLLEIGLTGYIARRGVENIIKQFNIASILKAFIAKKIS